MTVHAIANPCVEDEFDIRMSVFQYHSEKLVYVLQIMANGMANLVGPMEAKFARDRYRECLRHGWRPRPGYKIRQYQNIDFRNGVEVEKS